MASWHHQGSAMNRAPSETVLQPEIRGFVSKVSSIVIPHFSAQAVALILYLICSNTLLAYLLKVKSGSYPPPAVFWLSIIVILVAVMVQIMVLEEGSRWRYVVLAQIVGLTGLLRLVFLLPIPSVFGYDSYNEVNMSLSISEGGWNFTRGASDLTSTPYPPLHFLANIASAVLGTSLFDASKWLPALYTLTVIPILYLLTRSLQASEKAGLLGAFGMGTLYTFVAFHSTFVREGVGFLFMALTVYCYVKSLSGDKNRIVLRVLAILFASLVVFSHHMASFNMLVFFVLLVVVSVAVLESPRLRLPMIGKGPSMTRAWTVTELSAVFATLVIVLVAGYWINLRLSPLDVLVRALEDAAQPAQFSPQFPGTLRNKILVLGEGSFGAAFGVLALAALVWRRDRITWTFLLFASVMALISLGLFNRIVGFGLLGRTFMAMRFQLFAYLGIFPLVGFTVARVAARSQRLGIAVSALFILYAALAVFRIPAYFYTDAQPDWQAGEQRLFVADSERHSLIWMKANAGEAEHVLTNSGFFWYFPAVDFHPPKVDFWETLARSDDREIPASVDLVPLSLPRWEAFQAWSRLGGSILSSFNVVYDVGDVQLLERP